MNKNKKSILFYLPAVLIAIVLACTVTSVVFAAWYFGASHGGSMTTGQWTDYDFVIAEKKVYTMEAEDCDLSGCIPSNTNPFIENPGAGNASNGKSIGNMSPGSIIRITVTADENATVEINSKLAYYKGGLSSDFISITFGALSAGLSSDINPGVNGTTASLYWNWTDINSGTYNLEKGEIYTLVLTTKLAGANIDCIEFNVVSYGPDSEPHTYTWSDWKNDNDNHWRLCDDCDVKKDDAAHAYDQDYICTVCDYDGFESARKAWNRIEAESYDAGSGVDVQTKGTIGCMGYISTSAYAVYKGVYFAETPEIFTISYSGTNSTTATLRLDSADGEILASAELTTTGGWTVLHFSAKTAEVTYTGENITGFRDLYLCFTGGHVNIDYFELLTNSPGRIEAENFDESGGGDRSLQTEGNGSGGTSINYTTNGVYAVYKDVLFDYAPVLVSFRYSNGTTATSNITLRIGGTDGTVLAQAKLMITGAWANYTTATVNTEYEVQPGRYDLYLCMNSGMNIDYFEFTAVSPGRIEVEHYNESNSTILAFGNAGGTGSRNLGNIKDGDYTVYKNVRFTYMPTTVTFRYASAGDPAEPLTTLRLGSADGEDNILIQLNLISTGDWGIYGTITAELTYEGEITGPHDIYLCMMDGANIDYFEFN